MNEYSLKNIVKFLGIVVAVIIIFYFITVKVSENQADNKNETDEITVIDYDKILLGNIFTTEQEEFYVLTEEPDDVNIENYKSYIEQYKAKDDALPFYYADLSSAFNKKYLSSDSNFEQSDFRVSGTTLLKIKNKKIAESYTDNDSIINKLEEIAS